MWDYLEDQDTNLDTADMQPTETFDATEVNVPLERAQRLMVGILCSRLVWWWLMTTAVG